MSTTVDLYPGAEAYFQERREEFKQTELAEIEQRIAVLRDAYQATFSTFEIKYALGQASALAHKDNNLSRLYTLTELRAPDTFVNLEGLTLRSTNFVYEYEMKLIADDNAQIENFIDPELARIRRGVQTGLLQTEHIVLGGKPVVLSPDDFPLTPQTAPYQPTDHSPLDALPPSSPARQQERTTEAEDISFRERDQNGTVIDVVDTNARAIQSVRTVVDQIEAPAPKITSLPASLFEPVGAMPSDGIVSALTRPNAATDYVQSVRKQMNALPDEEARQAYLRDTLKPDRDYVLSQLEKGNVSDSKLGILKGLDGFLKLQIAKIKPVPNPTIETENPAGEELTFISRKAPPAHIPVTLREVLGEPGILPLVKAEPKKTPPKVVPTLTDSPVPPPAPKPVSVADERFSPERLATLREHIEIKLKTASLGNLVKFDADILVPAQKESREEMMRRATDGTDRDTMQHILDYNDFIRNARTSVRERVVAYNQTAESRAVADAAKAPKGEEATPEFMKPKKGFFASLAEKFKRPEPQSTLMAEPLPADVKGRLETAAMVTRAELAQKIPQPEKPSLFQRLRNNAGRIAAGVAVAGAAAIGTGLWMQSSTPDDAPQDSKTAAQKADLPPPTTNAFTAIAPADKATTPAVTAAAVEPAAKTADTVEPILKPAPAKTVRADFSAKSVETYQMPDALKVTFNDGSTSRFDKETWQKACGQLTATGLPSTVCDELAPKNS